jgi:hypothetical protein
VASGATGGEVFDVALQRLKERVVARRPGSSTRAWVNGDGRIRGEIRTKTGTVQSFVYDRAFLTWKRVEE